MTQNVPGAALPKSLTDNRLWLANQLEARATIGRGGTIHYNNDDAAIDEMAAEILRMEAASSTSNVRRVNAGCGAHCRTQPVTSWHFRALVCRIIGHRWEIFTAEQCPEVYRMCERCDLIQHVCNDRAKAQQ